MAVTAPYIEDYVEAIRLNPNGMVTKRPVDFSGASSFAMPSGSTSTSQLITTPVITGGLTASGSGANDFSASTGTFKTPSGVFTMTNGATVPTGKVLAATDSVGVTAGGIIVPVYETIQDIQDQVAAASWAVSHRIFVCDNVSGTYKVAGISVFVGTHSTSGTLNIEVAASGVAIAGGTNQMSSTINLAGSDNTTLNGTITTQTTIAAGSSVNLIFAGTVTSLLNCVVGVALQRLT